VFANQWCSIATRRFNLYNAPCAGNPAQAIWCKHPSGGTTGAIQRNLADSGREQARKVGDGLRQLKIPVYQVIAAQFCRTRETGYEWPGPLEITEDLNHQIGQRQGFDVNAARIKRLAKCRQRHETTCWSRIRTAARGRRNAS